MRESSIGRRSWRRCRAWPEAQFLGEPLGRDTLNAVGLGAAVLAAKDAEAVIGVFTADHLIEPTVRVPADCCPRFRTGRALAQHSGYFRHRPQRSRHRHTATWNWARRSTASARVVRQFREKPPAAQAEEYVKQGPQHYLWNSGMFVWRAATLLDCIRRYEPAVADGLAEVAAAWETSAPQ